MATATAAATATATTTRPNQDGPANPSIHRVSTDQGNKDQRLLRVDQIFSRKDRQFHFVKTAKATSRPDRHGKTALIVRRIISKQGMVAGVEIDIKSKVLRDTLLDIFKDVEGLGLNKEPPMAEPELLFHAAPHLISRKSAEKEKPEPDQSLINDIGTALRFVDEDFGSQAASLASLLDQQEITFDLLWALFPPMSIILAPKHGLNNQKQALKLVSTTYDKRENGARFYSASGRIITHDGEDFGWGMLNLEIDDFSGAKKISSLTFSPLSHHPDYDNICQELINRGRVYLSLIQAAACREYVLDGTKEKRLPNGRSRNERFHSQGRVMLDPEAFRIHNGGSTLMLPYVWPEYWMKPKDLNDEQLLLCAHWITGFSFTHKTWGLFEVAGCHDVDWNEEAFAKVVIEEKRRRLIHGLVKSHRQDEDSFDDIVQNKGKGLVGLLCGSPGVGKTLTAEAVAEITHRPLYVVSTGELGTDADVVDRRLDTILEITRRWGCVLLIDEADVFLATRGTDLARDTLVSIFLRRLEYFRGVLILTTNRHSEIDSAFQSRIHFTIRYPELDEKSRTAIWRNFIEKVAQTSDCLPISEEDVARLAKKQLNGRQIKNAVACAVSLAREEKEQVTLQHIEDILEILVH